MQRKQIKNYISSPLNYQGGKARILDQMLPFFPQDIDVFVDLFCGGCNVGMNVKATQTIYNDNNNAVIGLLKMFKRLNIKTILGKIQKIIEEYGFSETRLHNFKYYGGDPNKGVSVYNREKFLRLRDTFNSWPKKDNQYYILLYSLILFGFNNQIRFNDKGEYNLPVGKRDFNDVIKAKLIKFVSSLKEQNCILSCKDFRKFNFAGLTPNSLVYCDPPYIITTATYNEKDGWTVQDEIDLLTILDDLNARNIRFALSNVIEHEGNINETLVAWINRSNYNVHHLFMDYSNSNYQKDSKKKNDDKPTYKEVLITNY